MAMPHWSGGENSSSPVGIRTITVSTAALWHDNGSKATGTHLHSYTTATKKTIHQWHLLKWHKSWKARPYINYCTVSKLCDKCTLYNTGIRHRRQICQPPTVLHNKPHHFHRRVYRTSQNVEQLTFRSREDARMSVLPTAAGMTLRDFSASTLIVHVAKGRLAMAAISWMCRYKQHKIQNVPLYQPNNINADWSTFTECVNSFKTAPQNACQDDKNSDDEMIKIQRHNHWTTVPHQFQYCSLQVTFETGTSKLSISALSQLDLAKMVILDC